MKDNELLKEWIDFAAAGNYLLPLPAIYRKIVEGCFDFKWSYNQKDA